jgi:hypothetical protein
MVPPLCQDAGFESRRLEQVRKHYGYERLTAVSNEREASLKSPAWLQRNQLFMCSFVYDRRSRDHRLFQPVNSLLFMPSHCENARPVVLPPKVASLS